MIQNRMLDHKNVDHLLVEGEICGGLVENYRAMHESWFLFVCLFYIEFKCI